MRLAYSLKPAVIQSGILCPTETMMSFILWALLEIHISSQLLRCSRGLSRQAAKRLLAKNFLLTYHPYAALRNFFRALHLSEL
jgi:hypothetical protein